MNPRIRKLMLTVHVVTSVGWLGAAYAVLVLVITGITTGDGEVRRAAYLVLQLFDSAIWLPVGALALASGLALSLLTHWGLLRYYWVTVKLVLTVLVFTLPLVFRSRLVREAVELTATGADAGRAGTELLTPAIMGILILTTATVLSTYKPWGRTRHGRRVAARRVRHAVKERVTATPVTDGRQVSLSP